MNDFVRELSALPLSTLAILGLLFAALVLYAVLGGADYGGGVWDLLASGPRAHEQRQLIETAIGPVWEANHVWLIFVIVLLFTAFPAAFAALSTALHIPLTLMLLGIVLRGTSFTFRHYDRQDDTCAATLGTPLRHLQRVHSGDAWRLHRSDCDRRHPRTQRSRHQRFSAALAGAVSLRRRSIRPCAVCLFGCRLSHGGS